MREIPELPGYYASSVGLIYSKKGDRYIMIHSHESISKYLTVNIKQKMRQVHRLVASAWLENPSNKLLVNHKDGNKKNNTVENLEYVSAKENAKHAREVLKTKPYTRKVCQVSKSGVLIATFESIKEAMDKTGVSSKAISRACKNKVRHASNFVWCYKEAYQGKPMRKLAQCKPVLQYSLDGTFIARYESCKDAAEKVSALASNVSNACIGKLQTCKGFIWKYEIPSTSKDETIDWKQLDEYPLYKISKDGRVYSTWTKTFKKFVNRGGYHFYGVTNKGKIEKKVGVHRLVAMAYIPNPDPEKFIMVNHKDGNPSNNNVENLEWCTASQNVNHARSIGLVGPSKKKTLDSIGNEVDVHICARKPVIKYDKFNKEIARYDSIKEAAIASNISHSAISKVCCQNTSLKTAGGYVWRFS